MPLFDPDTIQSFFSASSKNLIGHVHDPVGFNKDVSELYNLLTSPLGKLLQNPEPWQMEAKNKLLATLGDCHFVTALLEYGPVNLLQEMPQGAIENRKRAFIKALVRFVTEEDDPKTLGFFGLPDLLEWSRTLYQASNSWNLLVFLVGTARFLEDNVEMRSEGLETRRPWDKKPLLSLINQNRKDP